MAMYLFTKDLRLRASINTQLHKGCISTTEKSSIKKTSEKMFQDPHPVLIIDESFSTEGVLPLLEYLISSHIPGPKILIPKIKQPVSSFVSEGNIAILYRPFTIEQLLLCAISVSSMDAIAPHISLSMKEQLETLSLEKNYESEFVGSSIHIKEIKKIISHIGSHFSAVHINGESGTGKEIVASLLKEASGNQGPFEVVNCSNIPSSLADVYLFGAKKGAYTDAIYEQKGCVKRADGGILFLDEIEDLSLNVQGKLLRLLETKEFTQLGSDEKEISNFKLISASNVDLKQLVVEKKLRFDLYNRINKIVIALPPLRARKEDIPQLIDYYLKTHHDMRIIEPNTLEILLKYDWPGNVRELFNTIEMLRIFNNKESILSSKNILVDSIFSA
ncbi:MAG: sigma-54-dependent Fis family transcriptional regulator [Spirochaetia bacterium]|nr:sigma-54-dependent Fis family transcriptional regulator [Spirochaetia bacterium]